MSMVLKTWTPTDVQEAKDPNKAFCEYLQQSLGVPYPTGKDLAIVRKKSKEFFEKYPNTNWYTLCRVAHWCKARKRRPARAWMVIDKFRDAWSQGFIPELTQTQREVTVEEAISEALAVETSEFWRRRLIMAQAPEKRREVLTQWQQEQRSSQSA